MTKHDIAERVFSRLLRESEGDSSAPTSVSELNPQNIKPFVKKVSGGKVLYHRSPSADLHKQDVSAEKPRVSKQSKRGATVGFYAYEDPASGEKFGEHVYEVHLPGGTPYLDLLEAKIKTSRVPPEVAEMLRDAGVGVVLGKDFIGPPEWIIISDELVKGIKPSSK